MVFLQRKVPQFQDFWHFAARVMPVVGLLQPLSRYIAMQVPHGMAIVGMMVLVTISEFLGAMAKFMPETGFGWFEGIQIAAFVFLIRIAVHIVRRGITMRTIAWCIVSLAILNWLISVGSRLVILEFIATQATLPVNAGKLGIRSALIFSLIFIAVRYEQSRGNKRQNVNEEDFAEEAAEDARFRCFQCGNIIPVDADACPQCGWTWK